MVAFVIGFASAWTGAASPPRGKAIDRGEDAA
jgi:hypothetical protein